MSAGTFNVARSVWEHPAFRASEFSEREAFIWLISEAAWKPRRHRAGGHVVDLDRGQLCHSVRFMASAWGWTPARVFRFLSKMREENMIEKRNSSETAPTVITLCNYDRYQAARNSDDAKPEQQRNSSETNYKKVIREEEKDTSNEVSMPRKRADTPKRAHRLSADWTLPDELREWAIAQGWPPPLIEHEAERMRDWSLSSPNGAKRDWAAAWRNWMRDKPKLSAMDGGRNGERTDKRAEKSEELQRIITAAAEGTSRSGWG